MPTTAGDIYVRSGATGAFTAVEYVQGGWTTVASSSDMTSIDQSRLKDGQIIWVESQEQLYLTRKFIAFETPGYSGTENSASFTTTNLGISGGGSTPTLDEVVTQGSVSTNAISASQFNFPENGGLFSTIDGTNYSVVSLQDNAYYTNLLEVRGKEDGLGIANSGGLKFAQFYEPTSTNYEIKFAGRTGTGAFDTSATLKLIVSGGLDVSGDITGTIVTSSITNFDTEVSRSAAAAGFGTGGGGGSGDITNVIAGNGLSGGAVSGDATLTLDTSSTHFINAVNSLSVFQQTGSVYATTNDIQITGSLTVGDGVLRLKEFTTAPSAEAGAIYYSASNFYFGVE